MSGGLALDTGSFVAFQHSAAGHEGIMTDEESYILVKPCTRAEIDFYESVDPDSELAEIIPVCLGSLHLSSPNELQILQQQAVPVVLPDEAGISLASTTPDITKELPLSTSEAIWGKKLETGLAIVLENLTCSYLHPNIMDVKLGSRLYDDSAPLAKRQRLDDVSKQTTSGSVSLRIAGMRIWEPASENQPNTNHDNEPAGHYQIYNKHYGKAFTAETVHKGFETFFFGSKSTERDPQSDRELVFESCLSRVTKILRILESLEMRLFSSSLLFVFEGDPERLRRSIEESCRDFTLVAVPDAQHDLETAELVQNPLTGTDTTTESTERRTTPTNDHRTESGTGSKEDEDSESGSSTAGFDVCTVKLIDLAHATWTTGQGRDENTLDGVRNLKRILESLSLDRAAAGLTNS